MSFLLTDVEMGLFTDDGCSCLFRKASPEYSTCDAEVGSTYFYYPFTTGACALLRMCRSLIMTSGWVGAAFNTGSKELDRTGSNPTLL